MDPLKDVRQTTLAIQSRVRKLDSDLRLLTRDQSLRADIRAKRAQELRMEAEAEVRQLRDTIPGLLQKAARDNAPRPGTLGMRENHVSGAAARRSLYSQRASAMLAGNDLAGIRQTVRDAIRTGDREQAQEFLTVAGRRLAGEYGAHEVSAMRTAAMDDGDRKAAAVHTALRQRADDSVSLSFLHKHVENALERAGSGDAYDDGDPHLGRAVGLWYQRQEETAAEAVNAAADSQDAQVSSVVEGD